MHVISKAFLSACPSVCLSVKRTDCDKTKETCAHILIPPEKLLILTRKMVDGGDLFYLKFSVKLAWSENVDLQSIFTCSASAP